MKKILTRSIMIVCGLLLTLFTFSAEAKAPKKLKLKSSTDMVLFYGGGHHRVPFRWDEETAMNYVMYTDRDGKNYWLFDSFLLLEFMDPATNGGPGKTLVKGYTFNDKYQESGNKEDWRSLIDYYFTPGSGVDAINSAVEKAKKTMGRPKYKRQIVIGIPEPIMYRFHYGNTGGTKYWGKINGEEMDFLKNEDRIKACKWFIDTVIKKFKEGKYKNIDLAGFYWVAEDSSTTSTILSSLGEYLNAHKLSFNWIPYFSAQGLNDWKQYGFNYVYYQPNYFFNEDIPYSRLEEACKTAKELGIGMEIELDNRAMQKYGFDYRILDYMKAYKELGIWENCRLAYYQGGWTIRDLKYSKDKADRDLYHKICEFIVSRPIRK